MNGLKYRLTLIDENAVERLRNVKNTETVRADKAESELHSLRSTYQNLLGRWNSLWNEPEYNEAARKVKERKEREARLAAEKQDRYQNILNRFIAEGRAALRAFALSNKTNFNDKEAAKGVNLMDFVLAAYGIISYFESIKGKIALIEFDNTIRKNIKWTDDYDAIRSNLLVNGRGGTTFPIRSIQNVLEDSSNELVTVLITDGELNNVNESVSYFREYLFDDNKLYIFVLGNSKSLESYRILKEIGAKIYNANSAKDFCDLVVSDLD